MVNYYTMAHLVENCKQFHGAKYKLETLNKIRAVLEKAGFKIKKGEQNYWKDKVRDMHINQTFTIYTMEANEHFYTVVVGCQTEQKAYKRGQVVAEIQQLGYFKFEVTEDYSNKSIEQLEKQIERIYQDMPNNQYDDIHSTWKAGEKHKQELKGQIERIKRVIAERA